MKLFIWILVKGIMTIKFYLKMLFHIKKSAAKLYETLIIETIQIVSL